MARLGAALVDRLATRKVTTLTGTDGAPTWWSATAGSWRSRPRPATLDADVVVCAVDPRGLPALAPYVARTMPGDPAGRSRTSAWTATLPDLPHELVLHGDPMLVVRTGGRAPAGASR